MPVVPVQLGPLAAHLLMLMDEEVRHDELTVYGATDKHPRCRPPTYSNADGVPCEFEGWAQCAWMVCRFGLCRHRQASQVSPTERISALSCPIVEGAPCPAQLLLGAPYPA